MAQSVVAMSVGPETLGTLYVYSCWTEEGLYVVIHCLDLV